MTPLKSIRAHCLWCCNGQTNEVRKCPKINCDFFEYRMGKKLKKGSLIKIIRKHCLNCGEGTWLAVEKCDHQDCHLHPYRNGKSPAHRHAWDNNHKPQQAIKKGGLIGLKK